MKYLLGFLSFFAVLIIPSTALIADNGAPYQQGGNYAPSSQIQWETNYDKAVALAKQQNKPILLLFTGSDWCTWCIRLEDEVFSSPAYADRMKDKFIYVKLDYPMNSKLPPDLTRQNKALKAKYKIEGFPTVVLLSPNEEKIASTGYRAGGPVKYGQMLLDMIGQKQQ